LLENLRYYIEEEGSVKNEQGVKVKADKSKIDLFRSKLNLMGGKNIFIRYLCK
jgi:phosphoglycerate kinase